jgi:hypothetical protein
LSDDEVRSLVRLLAAEPDETRHTSQLVLRLDSALKHAGLLGDPKRLPELGVILRDAGLTKTEKDGDVEGKPWLGRRFIEYVEPQDRERVRAQREEELRRVSLNEDEADRSWLREVVLEPEDLVQPWMHWEPPVVGALVQRHWDTKRTEARYDAPSRVTARPRIVVGARCDTLVSPKKHCSSCCCFELSWCLGDWIVDEYWQADDAIERVHGCGQVDGIVQGLEAPHCLRPYRRARVPVGLVRPSVREAYLALNPEGAPV